MFGSVALDVTIGLVFVFLLYSLLATIVNEIIATFVGLRARFLRKGIERMLNDEYREPFMKGLGIWYQIQTIFKRLWIRISGFFLVENYKFKKTLADAFYSHPYVYYMGENKFHSKPSYLKKESFSMILLSVLNGSGKNDPQKIWNTIESGKVMIRNRKTGIDEEFKIDAETQAELKDRLEESDKDLDKFIISLESWFEDTMDRASGWYKRKVQLILFIIGFVIAVAFNVDTFKIVNVLSKDKEARGQLVALANNAVSQGDYESKIALAKDSTAKSADAPDSLLKLRLELLQKAYKDLDSDAKDANKILAMGWGFDSVPVFIQPEDSKLKRNVKNVYYKAKFVILSTFNPLSNFFGFVVTALALSMGAAFWFDLLKKMIQIRGSGGVPAPQKEKTDSGEEPTADKK